MKNVIVSRHEGAVRWLKDKGVTDKIIEKINEDYKSRDRVDKNWYIELPKSGLK